MSAHIYPAFMARVGTRQLLPAARQPLYGYNLPSKPSVLTITSPELARSQGSKTGRMAWGCSICFSMLSNSLAQG